MDNNWQIIFKGELIVGFAIDEVKKSLEKVFNINATKVERLFSKPTVILQKNLSYQQAQKYCRQLNSLGLKVYIEEEATIVSNALGQTSAVLKTKASEDSTIKVRKTIAREHKNQRDHTNSFIESSAIWSFDFSGRYGRLNYINASIFFYLIPLIFQSIYIWIPFILLIKKDSFWSILFLIIFIIIKIILLVFLFRITILRLHDFDMSGWWSLLCILPVIAPIIFKLMLYFNQYFFTYSLYGILISIVKSPIWLTTILKWTGLVLILLIPGTKGENQYGFPVKKGSILGLICWIILILLLICQLLWMDQQIENLLNSWNY